MQYFDLESLTTGGQHCQKVKAPFIAGIAQKIASIYHLQFPFLGVFIRLNFSMNKKKLKKLILFNLPLLMMGLNFVKPTIALSSESQSLKNPKLQNSLVVYTSKEDVQEIYQLMKDVDDVFVFLGIEYWVDGGTLLGCVRHEGLIKWDDDLDICIEKKHKPNLKKAFSILESLDYDVKMVSPTIYNIAHNKFKDRHNINPWSCPCIDIQVMDENKGKIFELYYRMTHPHIFFLRQDLFPLKKLPFGPLNLPCAHAPHRYLEALYGPNYLTTAHVWNHCITDKMIMELGVEEKKPALPYKKLRNNFELLKEINIDFK